MKKKHLNLSNIVWKEEGGFVSQCLNVDVASCGDTKKEALANLREALELYFEDEGDLEMATVSRPEFSKMQLNLV